MDPGQDVPATGSCANANDICVGLTRRLPSADADGRANPLCGGPQGRLTKPLVNDVENGSTMWA